VIDVQEVIRLHRETVELWHHEPPANPYAGFLHVVCEQHKFNFQLWHEEDVARSPDVGDARIAAVKRAIDGYNQKRNDWIEKLDDFLLTELHCLAIEPHADARLNTETPGSTIDRLTILREQHCDLSTSLAQLLEDIYAGRKRLKIYRQFKMYNDPSLNPYLYKAAKP